MAETYYAQDAAPTPTMTVGELIDRLRAFDPAERVIFRSPRYGAFGFNTAYSIEAVEREVLERWEYHFPTCVRENEETGEPIAVEAHTQAFHAWSGVVIR